MIKHPFEPIIDSFAEIMILGSFPSVKSRDNQFYYMHPNNRFWRVLSELYQCDFVSSSVKEKIKLLQLHHIALYDIIESCDILKSDDSSIKNEIIVDIDALIKNTKVKALYFNGKIAFQLYDSLPQKVPIPYYYLPSTSSANASFTFTQLLEAWKIILNH